MGCAAANAVLDAFRHEHILEHIPALEQLIRQELSTMMSTSPVGMNAIKDIRGRGLMIGVEFEPIEKAHSRPNSKDVVEYTKPGEVASAIVQEAGKLGLLLLSCGPYDTVRLIPPLNISSNDLKKGLHILRDAIINVYNRSI